MLSRDPASRKHYSRAGSWPEEPARIVAAESLSAFEQDAKLVMGNAEWRAWYERFIPLCESGSREIFTIVE
jgi:hypothetical protein